MKNSRPKPEGGVLVAHPPRITVPSAEEPIRLLHRGFDGLEVAFKGALSHSDLTTLATARERAERQRSDVLAAVGPGKVPMHVAATGAPGGYRYRTDTGPFGETWFFKHSIARTDWNVRVSVKSLPIAATGLKATISRLHDSLAAMGIENPHESVGRIDLAFDFLMSPEFRLRPDQFVAHSRAHLYERISDVPFDRISPDEIQIYLAGRKASSVTIGKQPGRQIIVYNKLLEIIQKNKRYWFELWDIDPHENNLAIWRVEFRSGKKHLNEWRIRTFSDLDNQLGDLIENSSHIVRYVIPSPYDKNISRSPIHPLWSAVQREIKSALYENYAGVINRKIVDGELERIKLQYVDSILWLLPGALISAEYGVADIPVSMAKLFKEIEQRAEEQPIRFREKLARAKEKLFFVLEAAQRRER